MSQIYIFLLCLAGGILSFLLQKIILIPIKGKGKTLLADSLFFLFATVFYLLLSVFFDFGDFKGYMFLGFLCGFCISYKSFEILLDFFRGKYYNKKEKAKEKKI